MIRIASVENMRVSDKNTIETKTPSQELMYKAGKGIFDCVNWQGKILIACGVGNNAGDGYVVAALLKEKGFSVDVLLLQERFSPDGKYYFDIAKEQNVAWSVYNSEKIEGYDIILDCIFGTGFKGEITGKARDLIEAINSSGAYVVSADINSGLNGDNGLGDISVKSDLTISIGNPKSGHYLNMAKDKIGKLVNVDIGIDLIEKPHLLLEADDVKSFLGVRSNFSHKGTYGYVTLIGGCTEYGGAVKLANLSASAMRSGAGVVKLAVPKSLCQGVMPYLLESTLYPLSEYDGAVKFDENEIQGALNGVKSVAVGMGLGQRGDNKEIIEYILNNYSLPVIIDADGLNTLAKMDEAILVKTKCKVVLTPHLKEFERLSGIPIAEIQGNPIEYAKAYAKKTSAILLLKGATTIVTDGEDVFLINKGCPGMATAGSGDVLSGVLASMCASYGDTLMAVAVGAYINGLAGEMAQEKYGEISMVASDTAKCVGVAIKKISDN